MIPLDKKSQLTYSHDEYRGEIMATNVVKVMVIVVAVSKVSSWITSLEVRI